MLRPAVFVRLNEAHKVWFTEFPENKPVIAAEQQTKVVGVHASITAALDGRWRLFFRFRAGMCTRNLSRHQRQAQQHWWTSWQGRGDRRKDKRGWKKGKEIAIKQEYRKESILDSRLDWPSWFGVYLADGIKSGSFLFSFFFWCDQCI